MPQVPQWHDASGYAESEASLGLIKAYIVNKVKRQIRPMVSVLARSWPPFYVELPLRATGLLWFDITDEYVLSVNIAVPAPILMQFFAFGIKIYSRQIVRKPEVYFAAIF